MRVTDHRWPWMHRLSLALLIVVQAGVAFAAEPIAGRASVTDGDTVVIGGTRIRLHGIDAPESAQLCQDAAGKDYRCGQVAALALSDRIGESPISCEPRDTDRYGRTVAICRKGADDLNAWMVAQGHAVAYRRYSVDYVEQEAQARAAKRGIWIGSFEDPSEWRRARRTGAATRTVEEPSATGVGTAGACAIKGNISTRGDRIYHLPGTAAYARTVIDERSGERMFCSEDEAKAAGWRAPRG